MLSLLNLFIPSTLTHGSTKAKDYPIILYKPMCQNEDLGYCLVRSRSWGTPHHLSYAIINPPSWVWLASNQHCLAIAICTWLFEMPCDSEVTWEKLKPCALRHSTSFHTLGRSMQRPTVRPWRQTSTCMCSLLGPHSKDASIASTHADGITSAFSLCHRARNWVW